ncbi:MAG: hypothetical protein II875_09000 [Clostridia bacterium]|nr:hypothetical protein [Clostridia bacterium]
MSAPLKLNKLMLQKESEPDEYVSYDSQGSLLSRASFKRMWYRLMADAGCATMRDYDPHVDKEPGHSETGQAYADAALPGASILTIPLGNINSRAPRSLHAWPFP